MSLLLPSSKALRPSKSRRLTSLPKVAPTMVPRALTATTSSGSGLVHDESARIPISLPVPTAAIGAVLVKISASGPIPTSRYCDQAPCRVRCSFRRIAAFEPGSIFERSAPMTSVMVRRIASALLASPRACSSITRSSRLVAKVTPAALSACRSHGASR